MGNKTQVINLKRLLRIELQLFDISYKIIKNSIGWIYALHDIKNEESEKWEKYIFISKIISFLY